MSIQNEVNKYLSDEGGKLRTITVLKMSGDVDLPDNCYLHLRECSIGNLTAGRGCTVVIEQSTLSGTLTMKRRGALTMDKVIASGGALIDVEECKVNQAHCELQCETRISKNSSLDSYDNNRFDTPVGLKVSDNSTATLRAETIINCIVCIKVEENSSFSARNCELRCIETAIEARTFSQAEMLGGVLVGGTKYAYFGSDNCKSKIVGITEPITAEISPFYTEKYCETRVINCPKIVGDQFGISVYEYSRFEVLSFETIETKSICIRAENNSSINLANGKSLVSSGAECVLLKDSFFDIKNVSSILANSDCFFSSGSEIIARNIDSEILGANGCVVFSQGNDRYSFQNCNRLRSSGSGKAIFNTLNNSKFFVKNVDKMISEAGDGILGKKECSLEMLDVNQLQAVEGDGVRFDDDSSIVINRVEKINAGGFHGLKVGKNSSIRCQALLKLECFDGEAITLDSGSSLECIDFGKILATNGDAILATSSRIVLKSGDTVKSNNKGGVLVDGSGGSVYARDVDLIFGFEGDGIRVRKGSIEVISVNRVNGGGPAINAVEGTVAKIVSVLSIKGGEKGAVHVSENSTCSLLSVELITGLGCPGIWAEGGSEVTAKACDTIVGIPDSIKCSDVSKITIISSACVGDILVENNCQATLNNVSVTKDVMVLNGCSFDFDRCSFDFNFIVSGSSGSVRETTLEKDLIISSSNVTMLGLSGSSGNFIFESASIFAGGCGCIEWLVTNSNLFMAKCQGIVTPISGSVIHLHASEIEGLCDEANFRCMTAFNTVTL